MSQASVQYAIKSTCLLQSIILCFSRTLRVEKFDPQFVDVCVEFLIKVGPKRLPKLPEGVCAVLRLSNSGNRADYSVIAPRRMAKASQEDVAARERRRSRCLSALLNTFGSWGPELGRFVIYACSLTPPVGRVRVSDASISADSVGTPICLGSSPSSSSCSSVMEPRAILAAVGSLSAHYPPLLQRLTRKLSVRDSSLCLWCGWRGVDQLVQAGTTDRAS